MPKTKLLGSAPDKESIVELIKEYYCGSTISLLWAGSDGTTNSKGYLVFNAKGVIGSVRVIEKKNRFRFERYL